MSNTIITTTTTTINADIYFLAREELYDHEKPYSIQFEPHGDVPRSNVVQTVQTTRIRDIRQIKDSLRIEEDGFIVGRLDSSMPYEDFAVPEKVKCVYLEEVKALLQETLGTKNVAILEYLVRRRHAGFPISNGEEFDYAQPVATAHIDFSPNCLVEIIKDRYGNKAEALLKHHYQIVNVWKPLHGPLRDWPLALCKPSSVDVTKDLQPMDRVYAANIEESIQIHFSPEQEWCYLSDQDVSEVLIFRGGDSEIGMGAGAPHCSFIGASHSLPNRPRESVEVRALVFYTPDELMLDSVAVSRRHGPKSTLLQKQIHMG